MDLFDEKMFAAGIELNKALCKAQAEMMPAVKDATNPHFKSKYADLASIWYACRHPLASNGLCVTQAIQGDLLLTSLRHVGGGLVTSEMKIVCKDPTNPQSFGSALTYARRYALAALVGVVTDEDDDGTAAASKPAATNTLTELLKQNHYAQTLTSGEKMSLWGFLRDKNVATTKDLDPLIEEWRAKNG